MSRGGSTTQTTSIDPALRDAALQNLAMAQRVGQLGFVPYTGATVAGLQPAQLAAMQNTNAGLAAFGLTGSPMPTAGDLSPYAIYQQQLARMAPGQRAFIESMFIDPMTGAMPTQQYGAMPSFVRPTEVEPTPRPAPQRESSADRVASAPRQTSGGSGRSTTSINTPLSYAPGGVNTRNPNSVLNRIAAAASPKQSAPTAASRPMPRPTTTPTVTAVSRPSPTTSSSSGRSSDRVASKSTTSKGTGTSKSSTKSTSGSKKSGSSSGKKK